MKVKKKIHELPASNENIMTYKEKQPVVFSTSSPGLLQFEGHPLFDAFHVLKSVMSD